MLQLFKISGDSLFPLYKHGQRVLCRKVFQKTPINVHDTVIFQKEQYGLMIKKVTSVNVSGYFVEGTDPLSLDSRNFGIIPHNKVHYKVLFGF